MNYTQIDLLLSRDSLLVSFSKHVENANFNKFEDKRTEHH